MMKTYLIGRDSTYKPTIFEEYSNLKKGRENFRKDCRKHFDSGYAQAFEFKLVRSKNEQNAKDNYTASRNYMRKEGSKPGTTKQ